MQLLIRFTSFYNVYSSYRYIPSRVTTEHSGVTGPDTPVTGYSHTGMFFWIFPDALGIHDLCLNGKNKLTFSFNMMVHTPYIHTLRLSNNVLLKINPWTLTEKN